VTPRGLLLSLAELNSSLRRGVTIRWLYQSARTAATTAIRRCNRRKLARISRGLFHAGNEGRWWDATRPRGSNCVCYLAWRCQRGRSTYVLGLSSVPSKDSANSMRSAPQSCLTFPSSAEGPIVCRAADPEGRENRKTEMPRPLTARKTPSPESANAEQCLRRRGRRSVRRSASAGRNRRRQRRSNVGPRSDYARVKVRPDGRRRVRYDRQRRAQLHHYGRLLTPTSPTADQSRRKLPRPWHAR
jgi:hypothetical protein